MKKMHRFFASVYIIFIDVFRLFSTFFSIVFLTNPSFSASKVHPVSAKNTPVKNLRKNLLFLKKGIDFIDNRRYNVKLYDIMHKEV